MSRPYLPRALEDELRRLIDARRRELAEVPPDCPIGKGSEHGYKLGCRCELCRGATARRRREWRLAHLEHSQRYDRERRRRRKDRQGD